jgi:predicted Zn-dependent peptidase
MQFKKHILPNGVRVILVPMKDNLTVTFGMYACTGSLYETKEQAGISHFLEHMCFKGTKKRPTPRAISLELDSIGARYNAYTWLEKTCYWAKAGAEHFEKIADVVSDIYLNSVFPEDEIKKEKGVVLGEIDMYNDDPKSKVDDILMEHMYEGTPAERPTIGSKETVSAITRADLIKYRDSQYKAENTVIAIAGGVSEKEMLALAKKIGAKVKKGKWTQQLPTKDKKQKSPEMAVFNKTTDQAHIIVAFRSFDRFDKDVYIANGIANILRSGMSSRLFTRLREQMGSGYYVSAAHMPFADFGSFYISTGTTPERVTEIVKAILEEIARMKNEPVKKDELKKVQEIVRSGLKMGLESSDDVMEFFADQEVAKKNIKTPEDLDKIISSITAADIMRVAKRIFMNDKMNLAVVGPIQESPELKNALTLKG